MFDPNLMRPVDVGGMIQQGFQQGQKIANERQQASAINALMMNPSDPQALAAYGRTDPKGAMNFKLEQDKLTAERALKESKAYRDTIGKAAEGIRQLTSQGMPLQQAYQTVRQTLIANRFPGADQSPAQADDQYIQGIMALADHHATETPSSVREYDFAKRNGFNGSYTDFLQFVHPPSAMTIPYGSSVQMPQQPGGAPPVMTDEQMRQMMNGGQSGSAPTGGF